MSIRWTTAAGEDLLAIFEFIERDDTAAAEAIAQKIDAVTGLVRHPGLGRLGRVPGTRELVVTGTSYLVAYRIWDGDVQVLRVLHGARKWPPRL